MLTSDSPDIGISEIVQNAIDSGLSVQGVTFKKSFCKDLGTGDDLQAAVWKGLL